MANVGVAHSECIRTISGSSFVDVIKHLRSCANSFALALADITAFSFVFLLLGYGSHIPKLLVSVNFWGGQTTLDLVVIPAGLFVVIRLISGAYRRRQLFVDFARKTLQALAITAAPSLFLLVHHQERVLVPALLGLWVLIALIAPVMTYIAVRILDGLGLWRVPTALIAKPSEAGILYSAISNAHMLGFDIRYLVTNPDDCEVPKALAHLTWLRASSPQDLVATLRSLECQRVVIEKTELPANSTVNLVWPLLEAGIAIDFAVSFRQMPITSVTTSSFFGSDKQLLHVRDSTRNWGHCAVKRLFDIAVSSFLLVAASPFFALMAFLIWRDDGGHPFYAQTRIGYGGGRFRLLKFRTMRIDSEKCLIEWEKTHPERYVEFQKSFKIQDDPRITRIGRWLRKTSLDELPQLINVFLGKMSLVGPRPILLDEPPHYGSSIALYVRVRPGITGVWQVMGRNNVPYAQRVVYNDWYVCNQSLWLDFVILLRTFQAVLGRTGAS
jgi:Undecaprenyl-phosphate galactose phosphotransferase WbaP